jgi:hypothetical protein
MKGFRFALSIIMVLFYCTAYVHAEDAAPAAGAPAPAAEQPKVEEAKVTGSAGVAVLNKYVFRGYEVSAKSVVIEPTVTLGYRGFSATVWGNIDTDQHQTQSFIPGKLTDDNGKGVGTGHKSWNETDLTLSYTYNISKLGLTGGYIYYGTEYVKQTQELFVSATYDVISHPTIAINRDVDGYPGTYINLSFSQSLPVFKLPTGDLTVDLGAGFGYFIGTSDYWKTYESSTGGYTGSKYSALHDGNVKVGVSVPLGKNFVIQPMTQYWFPLSNKAKRTVDGISYNPNGKLDQTFVYGLNLSLSF